MADTTQDYLKKTRKELNLGQKATPDELNQNPAKMPTGDAMANQPNAQKQTESQMPSVTQMPASLKMTNADIINAVSPKPAAVASAPAPAAPRAPGLQYTPAPASQNAGAGMRPFDISKQVQPGAPLPYGAGRSASGAVIPDVSGRSTIVMGQVVRNPEVARIPVQTAAPTVPKESAPVVVGAQQGPPDITKIPGAQPPEGINQFEVQQGPMRPVPTGRVIPTQRDVNGRVIGAQINPPMSDLSSFAARTVNQPDTGGNVSVFAMSPEQQAEVAKRRDANIAQLEKTNEYLTRQNIMEGAHGPAEARRAAALIASMDSAAAKTAHAAAQTALETEKAKAEIFAKTAQAYKDLGLIDKNVAFDRQKATEKYMAITKDPVMANTMTDWEERKHAGTGIDISKKLDVYDPASWNKIPMHIYGVADKQHAKAASTIIEQVIAAQKKYTDSGFLGVGKGKDEYKAIMNAAAEQLQKMGIIMMPDVETIGKA